MASASPRASFGDNLKHGFGKERTALTMTMMIMVMMMMMMMMMMMIHQAVFILQFPCYYVSTKKSQIARNATWNSGINLTNLNSNFHPGATQPTIPIPLRAQQQETTASSYQGVVPSTTANSEVLIQNTKPLSIPPTAGGKRWDNLRGNIRNHEKKQKWKVHNTVTYTFRQKIQIICSVQDLKHEFQNGCSLVLANIGLKMFPVALYHQNSKKNQQLALSAQ